MNFKKIVKLKIIKIFYNYLYIALVIFTYEGLPLKVQCLKEDKMKDICNKYISKINININSLYFLYGGNQINLELTFKEQAN